MTEEQWVSTRAYIAQDVDKVAATVPWIGRMVDAKFQLLTTGEYEEYVSGLLGRPVTIK